MTINDLENYLLQQIPIIENFGICLTEASKERVVINAKLEPNRNHLGTAFGGSAYSISVLSCYAWLFNSLDLINIKSHVVIKSGQIKYLNPITDDFSSVCNAVMPEQLEQFLKVLNKKKKSQITLKSEIIVNSKVACVFEGEFVATI